MVRFVLRRGAMRPIAPVMLLLGLTACPTQRFYGEQSQVSFSSDLARDFLQWSPGAGVMPGTDLQIFAVSQAPWVQNHETPALVAPAVSGSAVAVLDAGVNRVWLGAISPGTASIDWVGQPLADGGTALSDHLTVRVADPDAFSLSDPFLFYRGLYPDIVFPDAGAWPDVDAGFTMAGGGRLYLEVLPAAAGSLLFFTPGVVSASATAPFSVETYANGVFISSPSTGLPARGTVTLSVDSGVVGAFEVAADELPVARGDIASLGGNKTWLIKATARTPDGGVWWDAPFVWTVPATLKSIDGGVPALVRRDVLVVTNQACDADDSGTLYDVIAAVGGQSATSRIALPPCEPVDGGETIAPPPAPPHVCGCESASPSGALFFALACLAAARRSRS